MKRTIICVALILVITTILIPSARPSLHAAAGCDPASVIAKANELKATDDQKSDFAALQHFSIGIREMRINCNGLRFQNSKSKKYVIDIPPGTYLVNIQGKGIYVLDKIEGECGQSDVNDNVFYEAMNERDGRVIVVGKGCQAVLDATSLRGHVVTFEPLPN